MTVCSFFLQGRCRYGDKCWNEHPRGGSRGGGGGGGGGFSNYNRSSAPQPRGGGFGNKVWVNPSQQKSSYIQPSSFSSHESDDWGRRGGGGGGGGNDWGQGGGGRRENIKSSEFSFSQNRFASLSTPSSFDKGGRGGGQQAAVVEEDDNKKLENIQTDMDLWERSGQWGFSCYAYLKTSLSGFTDLSPEELRLEYYSTSASGDLQSYLNGVNQLLNQWKSRVQELKVMNPATRAALLVELNQPSAQASLSGFDSAPATGFGSSTSSFGSKGFGAVQASTFSFASSSGFGNSATPSSTTGFGSASAAPPQPLSGFGSSSAASSAVSASSFSFSAPTSSTPAATSGFGSASGFSFSSTANTGGFGNSFGAQTPAVAGSSSVFGQTSGGFGTPPASAAPAAAASAGGALDSLFTPEDKLTPEELDQFRSKRFALGQIPLKPPPADMLMV